MKNLLGFFLLLGISLSFWACDMPTAYGDLSVTVLDDRGNELDSAEVTIYLTEDDYNRETNPFLGPFLTDEDGKLKVFNLVDSVYYLDVVKGNLNNWENIVRIDLVKTENGFNNAKIFILSDSRTGVLAAPEGKAWKISFIDPAANVPACLQDNRFIFYKGGAFVQEEGNSLCDPEDPQILISSEWTFNSEETELNFGYTQNPWFIISFNRSEISLVGALDAVFPGNPALGTDFVGFVLVPE
ncbi:MAG: hypothetical protein NW226_02995 [Microscillaceae bacterium]|nr:hypothetical protein [Microscillaceae bacterium]